MKKKYNLTFDSTTKTFYVQFGSSLRDGQNVIVCQSTNNPIIDFRTGKQVGFDENVLGPGIIKRQNGTVSVQGVFNCDTNLTPCFVRTVR